MLSKEERKRAAHEFREQKPAMGIYAVRCTPTGSIWVGSARNLTAARNGAWFSLRIGAHRMASLQNEWNSHGEPSFRFDVLETLDPDTAPLLVADALKTRKQHWLDTLGAAPLL